MHDHELNSFSDENQGLGLFALRAPVGKTTPTKRLDRVFTKNLYAQDGKPFEFLVEDSEQLSRGIRYIPTYKSTWNHYKTGIYKLFDAQHAGRTEEDIERGLFEADWAGKAYSAFDDIWSHAYFHGKPVASIPNSYSAIRDVLTDRSITDACLEVMLALTGWVLCKNKRGEERLFHPLLVRLAINAAYLTDYSDKALEQRRNSLKQVKKDLLAMNVPIPVKSYSHSHFASMTGYGLLDDPIFVYRKRAIMVVGNDFMPQRKDSPIFRDILNNPMASYEAARTGRDINIAVALVSNEVVGEKNPNNKAGEKYDRNKSYEFALDQIKKLNPYKIYSIIEPDQLADQYHEQARQESLIAAFTGKSESEEETFTGKTQNSPTSSTGENELDPAVFTSLNISKSNQIESNLINKNQEEKNISLSNKANPSRNAKSSEENEFCDSPLSEIPSQEEVSGETQHSESFAMRDIHPDAMNGGAYKLVDGKDAQAVAFNQRVFIPTGFKTRNGWIENSAQFAALVTFNGFAAMGGASMINLNKQWRKNGLDELGGVHVLALKKAIFAARKKRAESIKIGDASGMGCLCAYIVAVATIQSAIIKNIDEQFIGLSKESFNKLYYATNSGIAHASDIRDLGGVAHLDKVLGDCTDPSKLGLTLKKEAEELRVLAGSSVSEEEIQIVPSSRFHDDFV